MKLTKEEEELIMARRKEDEEKRAKKEGFLKKDLYSYDISGRSCNLGFELESDTDFWLCDKETKEEWIKLFTEHFELVLKKGTRFVCYIEGGKELWYDDVNYGVENMDEKWAKEYLINIRPL